MNLEFLKSAPGADPIIVERRFNAPPERLFRAWTEPEEIIRWFGPKANSLAAAKVDLQVGGIWRLDFPVEGDGVNALTGEYVEIVPARRLIYTWRHEQAAEGGVISRSPISTVTVQFIPQDDGTLLTINHAGGSEEGRKGFPIGWHVCLGTLNDIVEDEVAEAGQ